MQWPHEQEKQAQRPCRWRL